MKKRNLKKSEINLNIEKKSPSNFRRITESFVVFVHNERYALLASLSGLFFFCLLLYMIVQLSYSLKQQKQVIAEKEKVMHELSFWHSVTSERPEYRDGYFMLAKVQYQLGKKEEAKKNVQKALTIDPNFTEGKEFKQLLETGSK
jgi:tetratricopeptide (TPR) repeat protein